MKTYQIIFNLTDRSYKFDSLNYLLKELKGVQVMSNVWWFRSDKDIPTLRDMVKTCLMDKGQFYISELPKTTDGWLSENFWFWLGEKNQSC